MKHRPQATNRYRKIYIFGLSAAVFIVVAGSLWAYSDSIGFSDIFKPVLKATSLLTRSHLIVKIDHTRLPANGSAQTLVTASYPSSRKPITAKIIKGTGSIARVGDSSTPTTFTYTAGITVGEVVIAVSLDSITEEVSLELMEPITPTAPQITTPPTNSKTNQLRPEIIGTAPANSKIAISNNGQLNTTTKADSKGVFRIRLEKPLTNGQQTISAIAINDLDLASPPSSAIVIEIQSEPLRYDAGNIGYSPTPIIAGESFGIFIPASLNTEKVLLDFQGTTYELKDNNKTSVFSRSLPAPTDPGSYPASIILVDAANNATRFDNAINITVKAP